MLKDALRCFKHLSLYLQSNDATVVNASCHIDDIKFKLLALKQDNGRTLRNFLASFDNEKHYKNVDIIQGANDEEKSKSLRNQSFQPTVASLVLLPPSSRTGGRVGIPNTSNYEVSSNLRRSERLSQHPRTNYRTLERVGDSL